MGRRARHALSALISAALSASLLAGCAGKPPVISRVFAQPILVRDLRGGDLSEKLSVFIVASDPDGMEDLEAFYIINDQAELFWKVEKAAWMELKAEGESWIGTNALAVPAYEPLPAGEFRIVMQDTAGETAEQSFVLPEKRPSAADASYPSLSAKDGVISVRSSFPNPQIWVYDASGKFMFSLNAGAGGAAPEGGAAATIEVARIVATLPNPSQAFALWVYAREAAGTYAVMCGPYASETLSPK